MDTVSYHPGPLPRPVGSAVAGLLVVLALGTGGAVSAGDRAANDGAAKPSPAPIFSERTRELGIDFVHFNGMTGEFYMPETVGAGGALFDYDNDGDLDVYLVQGTLFGPGKTWADALVEPRHPRPLTDRLYRNDLVVRADGSRQLRFTDVTKSSGLGAYGYGMGVATADFDNDGWVDVYLTNFGPNQLWRNQGGTFVDVTASSGTHDERWSVSAAFVDYDRDGWLDLYVADYTRFTFELHKVCRSVGGAQDYCGPKAYEDERDRLLRNRRDGTFVDVTTASGVDSAFGAGLGVSTSDFNGDGWPDFYVANDEGANLLWSNQGNGTFSDEALFGGCAVNAEGKPEASMGVAVGDFDGDGDDDVFLTHLSGETNTLYVNDGQALFEDATIALGMSGPSFLATGFGTDWFDYDNDGWLDLLAVNGAVRFKELRQLDNAYPLDQPNQLFRNLNGRRFEDVSAKAGSALVLSEVSRGAAFGDVDNDGDTDLLITNNNGAARLLINEVGNGAHWLGIRAVDGDPLRDALGALVSLERPGQTTLRRRVRTSGSYASASDPRVLFGLGSSAEIGRLSIRWPDGKTETWSGLAVDRYTTLKRGSGSPPP